MQDAAIPQRKSPRLHSFDYASEGAYFVTVCSHQRQCLFGHVLGGTVHLSPPGEPVDECWRALPVHLAGVTLDAYVVMPNHLHGIVMLSNSPVQPTQSLGRVLNSFECAVTRKAQRSVWQSRYYDHIIRGESDTLLIREYISHKAARWSADELFVDDSLSDAL